MSFTKSLFTTTLIAAPTVTTSTLLEFPKFEKAKVHMKDGKEEIKGVIKEGKENVRLHRAKRKKKLVVNKHVSVKTGGLNNLVRTTIGLGTTTSSFSLAKCMDNHYTHEYNQHKNLSTYVSSMSEDELVDALERLNLLDSEDNSKTLTKTR